MGYQMLLAPQKGEDVILRFAPYVAPALARVESVYAYLPDFGYWHILAKYGNDTLPVAVSIVRTNEGRWVEEQLP